MAGFTAAFCSLLILAITSNQTSEKELLFPAILLGVTIEELLKVTFFLVIFNLVSKEEKRFFSFLVSGLLLGIGFSFFELILVWSDIFPSRLILFLPVILIHVISSVLIATAIYFTKAKKSNSKAIIFIVLAFLIHLCYNFSIVIIQP